MKKIKTKAELKSLGDFLKIGAAPPGGQDLAMLPLTCGLCYKVGLRRPPDISNSSNTTFFLCLGFHL